MDEPRIAVVIVDFRKGARVVANVRSLLLQYPPERLDIVVIDNSVDPANAALLEPLRALQAARLVINPTNIGYTAACNQGAAMANGAFVLLLNPDIVWSQADALRRLVSFMRARPQVAIAGPRQVNEDGTVPRTARRFPNVIAQFARRSRFSRLPPLAARVGEYEALDMDYAATQPVDWLQSSCLLIRRSLWNRIGGLDQRYFLFMADCALCRDAWASGGAVFHVADAVVTADGVRASAGGVRAIFRNPAIRHHLRDALLYHWQYFGKPSPRPGERSFPMASLEHAERRAGKVPEEPAATP